MPTERLFPPDGAPRLPDGRLTTTAQIAHRVGSYKDKESHLPVGAHPVRDGSWTAAALIAHRVGSYKNHSHHNKLGNTHAHHA